MAFPLVPPRGAAAPVLAAVIMPTRALGKAAVAATGPENVLSVIVHDAEPHQATDETQVVLRGIESCCQSGSAISVVCVLSL